MAEAAGIPLALVERPVIICKRPICRPSFGFLANSITHWFILFSHIGISVGAYAVANAPLRVVARRKHQPGSCWSESVLEIAMSKKVACSSRAWSIAVKSPLCSHYINEKKTS